MCQADAGAGNALYGSFLADDVKDAIVAIERGDAFNMDAIKEGRQWLAFMITGTLLHTPKELERSREFRITGFEESEKAARMAHEALQHLPIFGKAAFSNQELVDILRTMDKGLRRIERGSGPETAEEALSLAFAKYFFSRLSRVCFNQARSEWVAL